MNRRHRARWSFLVVPSLLLAACRLQPAVSVSARESMVGQGQVIVVTNTSEDFCHDLVVEVTSPDGEIKKYLQATLEPHDSVNVG